MRTALLFSAFIVAGAMGASMEPNENSVWGVVIMAFIIADVVELLK